MPWIASPFPRVRLSDPGSSPSHHPLYFDGFTCPSDAVLSLSTPKTPITSVFSHTALSLGFVPAIQYR
ncbi:hypothetical protein SCP_0109690 [Sparassis crispa]|uniref:Uncharacterized protein n=1 Tax=Sparassis crispa TaxID=139825 RepID=A0A401G7F5_9APHY|nr:hypothetical protein SCP_0109690 [Sparassis crispa]GBE78087.1 hypothetical protein SCP_0109690 [Sparassis crispa]